VPGCESRTAADDAAALPGWEQRRVWTLIRESVVLHGPEDGDKPCPGRVSRGAVREGEPDDGGNETLTRRFSSTRPGGPRRTPMDALNSPSFDETLNMDRRDLLMTLGAGLLLRPSSAGREGSPEGEIVDLAYGWDGAPSSFETWDPKQGLGYARDLRPRRRIRMRAAAPLREADVLVVPDPLRFLGRRPAIRRSRLPMHCGCDRVRWM